MKKWTPLLSFLAALFIVMAVVVPTLAAYNYSYSVSIYNNSSTAYPVGIPIIISINNSQLYGYGYIGADGLDTVVLEGATAREFMVQAARLGVYIPAFSAGQVRSLSYRLGNTPAQTTLNIIPGYGGKATISDAAALELGDNFTIQSNLYVKTNTTGNIFKKPNAFTVTEVSSGSVNATILNPGTVGWWYNATSTADSSGHWMDDDLASDHDMTSYAYNNTIPHATFSDFLAVNFTATDIVGVRYKASAQISSAAQIDVDYYDGSWHDVYQGALTIDLITPKTVNAVNVTSLRVRIAHDLGAPGWVRLKELQYGVAAVNATAQVTGLSAGEKVVEAARHASSDIWSTGTVAKFDSQADSVINATELYNNQEDLWISFWFILDNDFIGTQPPNTFIDMFYKTETVGADMLSIYLDGNNNNELAWVKKEAGGTDFSIRNLSRTSWTAGTAYHVLCETYNSTHYCAASVDGSVETEGDTTDAQVCASGELYFGGTPNWWGGYNMDGTIFNIAIGTTPLTAAQKAGLLVGEVPSTADNYWYVDEGTGTTLTSEGTSATTASFESTNVTWGTATYTGSDRTGRLNNFALKVGGSRAGKNLTGMPVTDNAHDWELMSDAVPYTDYYKHSIDSTLIAWYEPNTMIVGSVLSDRQGGDQNGSIVWGSNPSGIEVTTGGFTTTASTVSSIVVNQTAPELLEAPPTIEYFPTVTESELTGMPQYDSVARFADSLGMSTANGYLLLMWVTAMVLGFAGLLAAGTGWGFVGGYGFAGTLALGTPVPFQFLIITPMIIIVLGLFIWGHVR